VSRDGEVGPDFKVIVAHTALALLECLLDLPSAEGNEEKRPDGGLVDHVGKDTQAAKGRTLGAEPVRDVR